MSNFTANEIVPQNLNDVQLNEYFVDNQTVNKMITNSSSSSELVDNNNDHKAIEEDSVLADVHQSTSSRAMEMENTREQSNHDTIPKDHSKSDFPTHKNFQEICRCCLEQSDESQMKSIFDKNDHIMTMLVLLSNVQLSPGDGLPENICINCLKQLTQCINFKQQIEANDIKLKNYFAKGFQEELDRGRFNINPLNITENEQSAASTGQPFLKKQISKTNTEMENNNESTTEGLPEIVYMDEDVDYQNEKFDFNVNPIDDEIDVIPQKKTKKKLKREEKVVKNLEIFDDKDEFTCEKCDKVYPDRKTYLCHIDSHLRLFFCQYCKQSFKYQAAYKNHLKCHTTEPSTSASSPSLSNDNDDLWNINDKNLNEKFKCEICGLTFTFEVDLFVHGSLHDSDEKFICRKCEKEFPAIYKLKRHLPTHYEDKPYKCDICGMGFPEKASLTRHLPKHNIDSLNREKMYSCKICDKKYYDSHSLMIHTRTHTGERPWKCKLCDKAFIDSRLLNSHIKTHTKEKSYKCDVCFKGFTHASTLTTHLRLHTGEKPYVCGVCDKTFIQASNLNLHMRVHTGEKPYSCEICSMSFASSSTLTTHIQTHYNEKPYNCPVCNKNLSRSHLKSHMRIHLGIKPYECKFCLKKFRTSSQLNQHKKKIHLDKLENETFVSCEICNEHFINFEILENHKNLKHSNDDDENFVISDNVKKLKNKIQQIKEQELIEEIEISSILPHLNDGGDDGTDKNLDSNDNDDDSNYNENAMLVNNLLSAVTGCTSMEDSYNVDNRHLDCHLNEQQQHQQFEHS